MVPAVTAPRPSAPEARTRAPARAATDPLAVPAKRPHARVPLAAEEAPADDELAAAKDAADRCACVIAGLFTVTAEQLRSPTRGSPRAAFARMVWMAGLADGLGFRSLVVGEACGRTRDTVEHARVVIDDLRHAEELSAEDLIYSRDHNAGVFSEADVLAFFGDRDGLAQMLAHAAPLIRRAFAAFELVAISGPAFSRALAERDRKSVV